MCRDSARQERPLAFAQPLPARRLWYFFTVAFRSSAQISLGFHVYVQMRQLPLLHRGGLAATCCRSVKSLHRQKFAAFLAASRATAERGFCTALLCERGVFRSRHAFPVCESSVLCILAGKRCGHHSTCTSCPQHGTKMRSIVCLEGF